MPRIRASGELILDMHRLRSLIFPANNLVPKADHSGWVSNYDRPVRNILRNHGSCADNNSLSNVYARENNSAVANPYVIPDLDRLVLLETLLNHWNLNPGKLVVYRKNYNILTHHHIVTDYHCSVQPRVYTDSGVVANTD